MKTKLKVIASVAMIVAILASVLPFEMAGAASSAATVKGAEKTFAALKARYEKADARSWVLNGIFDKYEDLSNMTWWGGNAPAELQKFYTYAQDSWGWVWKCAAREIDHHPGFQNGKVINLSEANGTNRELRRCLDNGDYWANMAFAQRDYLNSILMGYGAPAYLLP
jgi:hypothetical protein